MTEGPGNRGRGSRNTIKSFMQRKLALTFGFVALALFVLVIVILRIVLGHGEEYSRTVLSQQNYSSTTLAFRRGSILDRNQTILAASEQVYRLILDPSVFQDASVGKDDLNETIDMLADVFGYDRDDLKQVFKDHPKSAYYRYADEITQEKRSEFEKKQKEYNEDKSKDATIRGVWFEDEYKRVYPNDSLACSVLGFSGSDSSKGNWGIEQYCNDYLVGTDGREFGYLNSEGVVERTVDEPQDGGTVITTLDYSVQKIVENAIARYKEKIEADNIGVIVMDPDNAEILAMATDKSYNLNEPTDLSLTYSDEEISKMDKKERADSRNQMWRNFCISDAYEPGSTAKAFTVAAALEENVTRADAMFHCDGGLQVADKYIRCAHTHGDINLSEALSQSCNVAMMELAETLGSKTFYKYQKLFGLGQKTGVDLPGEAAGLLYDEDQMGPVELASCSFGQTFTASMIQIAAAYCSILNGGSYYRPHIVKKILNADGEIIQSADNAVMRRTVSEQTAQAIRTGLQLCVTDGTGTNAQIAGYSVGGKTGTSQKHPLSTHQYVLSFAGFTPVDDPQLLIYVVFDNPHDGKDTTAYEVGDTAVKLEYDIMASLVEYLNIPKDSTQTANQEETTTEAQTETDADGNVIEPTSSVIEPTNAGDEWKEKISDGFIDEKDDVGLPTETSAESSAESSTASGEENGNSAQ